MGFLEKYHKYFEIEWKAQILQKKFKNEGPIIEILTAPSSYVKNLSKNTHTSQGLHYLIIQGSFDPPTVPHLTLISKSVEILSKQHDQDSIRVIVLLSLAHVEKIPNVLRRSLLGERVEMIEYLLEEFDLNVPIMVGLSNVARYIDLNKAAKKSLEKLDSLTFITGMDVFKKIFDSDYYSSSLDKVLPDVFKAKFIVASRNDIIGQEQFNN
jgi:nicotinic acid mononucleotide adenylyltransferase